jgi:Ca2+/Na+ antiporter
MLPPGIVLVLLCLYLVFLLYAATHSERLLKKRARKANDQDRFAVFYLWFYRIMTLIACILLIYAIIEFALLLAEGRQ